MLGRLRSLLQALLRRARFERGMSDELQFHVNAYEADLRRNGITAPEARRQARAAFGSVEVVREECRRARGLRWWDEARQDVGYALRLMRRTPAFTAAVVLSLGLGIGANTAIFSLIDAVLLRSLPVSNPGELYFLGHGEGDRPSTSSNYPLFERYRNVAAFSGVTAYRIAPAFVSVDGTPEQLFGQFVSGNFHAVAGVPVILGRGFLTEPDTPSGREDVVVISEGYWARRFNRAPDVIGRTVTVQDRPVTIVGVTAEGFTGFFSGTPIDITMPLAMWVARAPKYLTQRDGFESLRVIARLRPDVPAAQAQTAADAVFQQFMLEPDVQWARKHAPAEWSVARLLPARAGSDDLQYQYRVPLFVLMGMAALVLLVASANIANLLLARSGARVREMAIRLCVGSGRGRVVRQMLTESAVLSVTGGLLGVMIAFWGTDVIVALFSGWQRPIVLDVAPNLRVLAFTTGVALVTGLAFGIAPAIRMTRVDLAPSLKGAPGSGPFGGPSALTRGLIVVQVALSVVVLATSVLLGRSVHNLKGRDAGFDRTNVLLFDVAGSGMQLPQPQLKAFYADILGRLQVLPGVTSASLSTMTPLNTAGTYRGVVIAGLPETPDDRGVYWNQVSPDYFRTAGVKLVQGRGFDDRDLRGDRPVAILNERAARHIFRDGRPIGGSIEWMSAKGQFVEVVGVVEDTTRESLREVPPRMVYTPLSANTPYPGILQVAAKTSADPRSLAGGIRDLVKGVSPDLAVIRIRTMEDQVNASMVSERGLAWLSGGFAVLASLLACVGLYGMLSYQVACRTREIGIRLAIGARPAVVLAGVLRQSVTLAVIGIAIGLVGTWFATDVVSSFLFGLSPRDPLTLAAVAAGLGVTTLAASYVPAKRAARVDPLRALRLD